MPMDLSYTDLAGLYPHNEGVYHALFMCPHSRIIDPDHRIHAETPPKDRRPCKTCLEEIKGWLESLPEDVRPSWFQSSGA
jgi:hypothetical protein